MESPKKDLKKERKKCTNMKDESKRCKKEKGGEILQQIVALISIDKKLFFDEIIESYEECVKEK